jgi:hypothetical protein
VGGYGNLADLKWVVSKSAGAVSLKFDEKFDTSKDGFRALELV